ncbi:MAG: hypothetical protein ACRD3T_16565 [Terriglobia bacterium]
MTQKILRSSLAWLTFCGLVISLSVFPISARGAQPSVKSSSQKTTASSTSKSSASHKGMVWVNPKTKIFHRAGDRWYGKSKGGKYMTEADAIKAGYKPAKPRHQLPNEKKKP